MLKKIFLGLIITLCATSLNAQDTDIVASQSYDASYNDLAYSAPAFPVGERMKGRVWKYDVMFVFAPLYTQYNGYIGYYYHLSKGDKHRNRYYIDEEWDVYNPSGRYIGQFLLTDGAMYKIYFDDGKDSFGVKIFGNWDKYTYNYWP